MVCFLGSLQFSRIQDFWKYQDIMVSCSELADYRIFQCGAMATGAVPTITDVFGARNDVTDGENGFVVEVDQIVEKICFL